jgi:hypothetical protein
VEGDLSWFATQSKAAAMGGIRIVYSARVPDMTLSAPMQFGFNRWACTKDIQIAWIWRSDQLQNLLPEM